MPNRRSTRNARHEFLRIPGKAWHQWRGSSALHADSVVESRISCPCYLIGGLCNTEKAMDASTESVSVEGRVLELETS